MEKEEDVFENKLFLKLRNKNAESDFQDFLHKQRIKYNKWFSGALLILIIGDIIFQNSVFYLSKKKMPNTIYIKYYTSYVVCFVSLLLFILVLLIKKHNFQIFISYVNFCLFIFPMLDYREIIFKLGFAGNDVEYLLRTFEMMIKIIFIMLFLTAFPHGLYMNLTFVIFVLFYNIINKLYFHILFYVFSILVYIVISYFYTKAIKEVFLARVQMDDQMNWYVNLFDHLNSGFLSFGSKDNRINIVNKSLLEILYKNREIGKILNISPKNSEEQSRILSNMHTININMRTEETNSNEDIIKNNSEKVLNILMEGIYQENSKNDSKDIFSNEKEKRKFDLSKYLNENKKLYISNEMNEKFMLLGFKDLEVDEIINYSNESNKKTNEIHTMVVYFRYRIRARTKEEEIEIIFNDIRKIIKSEEKNAELKYKTMFLSKIAHEFKNPIICISELVNNYHETYTNELKNTNNVKLKESFKHLSQIISFADYLLILIKDLDFYSQLHIKKEHTIINEIVNFNENLDFCHQMADILLQKFNKQSNVKFVIENNLTDLVTLFTDGMKLKQVLINLISNAIKFTNLGLIKLKLDLLPNVKMINFKVSDTGVGMSEEQLKSLIKPFKKGSGADIKYGSGLGLFIVNQMLKQLGSELIINSKVGEGTEMSFSLPCQVEEQKSEEETQQTEKIIENDNNFVLNDHSKLQIKFEDEEESPKICFKNRGPVELSDKENVMEAISQISLKQQLQLEPVPLLKPQPDCSYFVLVDDETFTLKSSARNLKKVADRINKKIEIFETEDGIECLNLIYRLIKRGFRITAIVSDELMNHMNGTTLAEVLKKIKNLNTAQIPFFLLTAYPNITNNFIDYLLSKPLNTKDAEIILNSTDHIGR